MIQKIYDPFNYEMDTRTVVTIGKFDGIHRGHQELIRRAVRYARAETAAGRPTKSVVFSFDMAPAMILTSEERARMLEGMGVDAIAECEFGPKICRMSAEDFISLVLVRKMHICHIIVGPDFRFGYERRGDAAMLQAVGTGADLREEERFTTEVVSAVRDEETGEKISSTRVRNELSEGHMERVNALLGYTYFVSGEIIRGRQVGRTIGIPTANLRPDPSKILPPKGVYESRSVVTVSERTLDPAVNESVAADVFHYRKRFNGVTDIGTKPTVGGTFVGVETYFFDCDEDLYGKNLRVELLHFARPEMKFRTLDELKAQILGDAERGRRYFRNL